MTMLEISELVGLVATSIGLIASIIGWVNSVRKKLKDKKLKTRIEELMIEIEGSQLSGIEKKQYVLMQLLKEYKGNLDEITRQASDYIEQLIAFSKKVNHK